jgi:hypothetical protein
MVEMVKVVADGRVRRRSRLKFLDDLEGGLWHVSRGRQVERRGWGRSLLLVVDDGTLLLL